MTERQVSAVGFRAVEMDCLLIIKNTPLQPEAAFSVNVIGLLTAKVLQ